MNLEIVHELLSLVRPSFRRVAGLESLGQQRETHLPAPLIDSITNASNWLCATCAALRDTGACA